MRLRLGQSCPRNLRIGEDDRWNRERFEDRAMSLDGFNGYARLVRGLVRQHRLPRHIADREDRRLGGAALAVGLDESLRIDLHAGLLEAGNLGIRPPPDGDEHAIEGLIA